jgi:hypothetical protein
MKIARLFLLILAVAVSAMAADAKGARFGPSKKGRVHSNSSKEAAMCDWYGIYCRTFTDECCGSFDSCWAYCEETCGEPCEPT